MNRSLFLILFIVSSPMLIAQTTDSTFYNTIENDSVTNTKYDLLMFSLSYSSNNIKYKNLDSKIKMPTYSADLSYFHKSGMWASFDYTNYYLATYNTYETDFQIGYQKTIIDFMDVDISYLYHNFKGDTIYEGISYEHEIMGSLTLNSKYISIGSDFYYMNGLTNNFFTDLNLMINLDFDNLFFKNDFLMFTPSISGHFGTDDWIFENYTPMQYQFRKRFLNNRGYTTGAFEYQSLGIYLPLIYSYSNISISLNWFYDIPSKELQSINWEDQGGFLISLIYTPIF